MYVDREEGVNGVYVSIFDSRIDVIKLLPKIREDLSNVTLTLHPQTYKVTGFIG